MRKLPLCIQADFWLIWDIWNHCATCLLTAVSAGEEPPAIPTWRPPRMTILPKTYASADLFEQRLPISEAGANCFRGYPTVFPSNKLEQNASVILRKTPNVRSSLAGVRIRSDFIANEPPCFFDWFTRLQIQKFCLKQLRYVLFHFFYCNSLRNFMLLVPNLKVARALNDRNVPWSLTDFFI